jgi:hypothetical protein
MIEDQSEKETESYLRNLAGPGEDKSVRPYKKEEGEERQNLVNEEQALSEVGERSRMSHRRSENVSRPGRVPKAKREYLASEMLSVLHDEESLGYYRLVAETVRPHKIFEALSEVRLASREGTIRSSRGAYFTNLIQNRRPQPPVELGDRSE